MDYETTDDEVVQPSGNMIPIAIAVLGIVLGTAGLYFGFNANKRLNLIDTSIQENTTGKAEIEKMVNLLQSRITEQEKQILDQQKTIGRLRVYASQNEQNIKKVVNEFAGELNKHREQIVKTANDVNEIKAGKVQIRVASNDSDEQTSEISDDTGKSRTRTEGRTYTIVSGDNFSKIANRFGIPLQSIVDANPDTDSRRLAIGQKIIIPNQ